MKTPKLVREAGDRERGAPAAEDGRGKADKSSAAAGEHDASEAVDADRRSDAGEDA